MTAIKRNLQTIMFAAVLLPLVLIFARTVEVARDGTTRNEADAGAQLDVKTLAANETIIFAVRSSGCFHQTDFVYQIDGGPLKKIKIAERLIDKRGEEQTRDVLISVLKPEQAAGLNGYLKFLRDGDSGWGCTTSDSIRVGYYRDGQQIGFEGFTDSSCVVSGLSFPLTEAEADENLRRLYRMGLNDEEASNLCTPTNIRYEENERLMRQGRDSLLPER